MLRWAREARGYDIAEAARRLDAPESFVSEIESGASISFADLVNLAAVYRQPTASFFRGKTPPRRTAPPDRRTGSAGALTREAYIQIAEARRLQYLSAELLVDTGGELRPVNFTRQLHDSADASATRVRGILGVSNAEQLGWKDTPTALKNWRAAVESLGILVFQLPLPSEIRGFSFADSPQCITITNSTRDSTTGRIFTLFHELGHIVLRQPGICVPFKEGLNTQSVEGWCNQFAGALLMPENLITSALNVSRFPSDAQEAGRLLLMAANRLKVSRYALLTRLVVLNLVTRHQYDELAEQYRSENPRTFGKGKPGQAIRNCVNKHGQAYIELVARAVQKNVITIADAAMYLSAKPNVARALVK